VTALLQVQVKMGRESSMELTRRTLITAVQPGEGTARRVVSKLYKAARNAAHGFQRIHASHKLLQSDGGRAAMAGRIKR
jgi:hypothetical protein